MMDLSGLTTLYESLLRGARGTGVAVPTLGELTSLLEAAFWASLEREEDRPVRFALAYKSADPVDPSHLYLARALPLSTHQIVKLAPSLVPSQRALGVTSNSDGTLSIWGSLPLPDPSFYLSIAQPGQVGFRIQERTRWVLRAGKFISLASGTSDNLLYLIDQISRSPVQPTPLFLALSEALERAIQAMLRQGHGGTLIWIPQGHSWMKGVKNVQFPCSPAYEGLSRAVEGLFPEGFPQFEAGINDYRSDQAYLELTSRMRRIQPEIDSLGQLTAVDGATVVDEDLRVLGYGVMLRSQATDTDLQVLVHDLRHGRAIFEQSYPSDLSQLGGARHRSAAEFCATHPEGLAFVASQDGTLTILGCTADEAKLFAIRHAELALH